MTTEEEKKAEIHEDSEDFRQGLAGIFSQLLQRSWAEPFILARRMFGDRLDLILEPGARFLGKMAGMLGGSILKNSVQPGEHALEVTLHATRLAENATGIFGRDYYISDKKIVRRIHTCPYRNREGAAVLCHVGESAGQELFSVLVPGSRHKVHVTMARGHAFCEYSYETD